MSYKKIYAGVAVLALVIAGCYAYKSKSSSDAAPQTVTLSGTYVCLPHADTTGPQTDECKFGFKTDDGDYYAVNFGASAEAMAQFQDKAHISAEGFIVARELLSSSEWMKYTMKGVFTITRMLGTNTPGAKLNIDAVCQGALAYMSFPDAKAAETFVAECKEGKHPEVIEKYKKDMNLGDGATI